MVSFSGSQAGVPLISWMSLPVISLNSTNDRPACLVKTKYLRRKGLRKGKIFDGNKQPGPSGLGFLLQRNGGLSWPVLDEFRMAKGMWHGNFDR